MICPECNHDLRHHTANGCEADRTHHADGIEIDGPCGCRAHEQCFCEKDQICEFCLARIEQAREFSKVINGLEHKP